MTVIVHIITGLGSGGAERMLARIATIGQAERVSRQVVISLTGEGFFGPALKTAGVELHCLGMRGFSLFPLFRLVFLLRHAKPDLVMTWLYHADLMGTLASLMAGCRRVVWNLRCSNMDMARYARTTRWAVAILAHLSRIPWAIVSNSEAGRRTHTALGYRPRRWCYLPNGFDLEEWRPDSAARLSVRQALGIASDAVVLTLVARVDPMKDHAGFLDAAARVAAADSRVHFLLAGRGATAAGLAPYLRAEALDGRVSALGERRDVARLLQASDGLVLSSAFGEGFPNVIGEAMATGLPCIVTDVGDASAIVGDAGWVVPPNTPAALAEAMLAFLALSPQERLELGARCRHRIADNYDIVTVVAAYRRLFDGLEV